MLCEQILDERYRNPGLVFLVSGGGVPWEGTLGSPRDPMGGEPLGAQGIPWEGTLGSPRDPMGGNPWEPKGSHGRGPQGAQASVK